jgi:hypothetical protein
MMGADAVEEIDECRCFYGGERAKRIVVCFVHEPVEPASTFRPPAVMVQIRCLASSAESARRTNRLRTSGAH